MYHGKPEWYIECHNRHQQPGAIVSFGCTHRWHNCHPLIWTESMKEVLNLTQIGSWNLKLLLSSMKLTHRCFFDVWIMSQQTCGVLTLLLEYNLQAGMGLLYMDLAHWWQGDSYSSAQLMGGGHTYIQRQNLCGTVKNISEHFQVCDWELWLCPASECLTLLSRCTGQWKLWHTCTKHLSNI